jgi:hypothetical protein
MAGRDDTKLKDAESRYELLLKDEHYSDAGRANLWTLIADTRRYRQDWKGAKSAYENALKLEPSPVCSIFLAECLLQLDNFKDGRAVLADIPHDKLDAAGKLDHALVAAAFAIESGEPEDLKKAKAALELLDVREPYFRDRKNMTLLNLQEALAKGTSRPLLERAKRLLAGLKGGWLNYVILKPSFMGMGVDVGKMIEDATKNADAAKEKPSASPKKASVKTN